MALFTRTELILARHSREEHLKQSEKDPLAALTRAMQHSQKNSQQTKEAVEVAETTMP